MFAPVAQRRKAITLVELLIVIAIIGLLVQLTLPAVQVIRRATRMDVQRSLFRQAKDAEYFPYSICSVGHTILFVSSVAFLIAATCDAIKQAKLTTSREVDIHFDKTAQCSVCILSTR